MAFLQRLLITNYSYSDREKENDNAILLSYLTVLLNINRRESGIELRKNQMNHIQILDYFCLLPYPFAPLLFHLYAEQPELPACRRLHQLVNICDKGNDKCPAYSTSDPMGTLNGVNN
jgi:hypothetical protein